MTAHHQLFKAISMQTVASVESHLSRITRLRKVHWVSSLKQTAEDSLQLAHGALVSQESSAQYKNNSTKLQFMLIVETKGFICKCIGIRN